MLPVMCAVALIVMPVTVAHAQSAIPNANLSVTVQQKEDGKIAQGFHVLELSCWDGACSLKTLSLNQCGPSGFGKPAFWPKVRISSTSEKSLRVHNEGK